MHVDLIVAPEVELPDSKFSTATRKIAFLVCEGEPQLNKLEHVHIAPACIIAISGPQIACCSSHSTALGVPITVFSQLLLLGIPQGLIYELSAAFEVANRAGNHPRKFCVHCYVGIVVHNAAYRLQLLVEIVLPYLSDAEGLTRGQL